MSGFSFILQILIIMLILLVLLLCSGAIFSVVFSFFITTKYILTCYLTGTGRIIFTIIW